ncbi:hypothetical protein [Bacillus swezeyi]|uniref:hypothetical protein n=1 Tax=Bacillus swezeyi TaxID=1925020 RepID=UPI003F8B9130
MHATRAFTLEKTYISFIEGVKKTKERYAKLPVMQQPVEWLAKPIAYFYEITAEDMFTLSFLRVTIHQSKNYIRRGMHDESSRIHQTAHSVHDLEKPDRALPPLPISQTSALYMFQKNSV